MGLLMVLSSFLLFPMTLCVAAYGLYAWRGGWRKLAAVPLVAVVSYFAFILIPAWAKDPTSHNLFPFELGIYLSPTIPFMLVVAVLHRRAEPAERLRALKCRQCGVESAPGPAICGRCGASLKDAERLTD
jgi:hypothetical protein